MELLNKIQQELKAPKGQFNSFGKYKYRNCEDILEAVKPLLGKATLTLTDEVVEVGGRHYVKATATLEEDIGKIAKSVSAYAREALEKKGMDEAQVTGAASSYARKYALNGLFCIDDTKDADSHENTPQAPTAPAKAPVAAKPTPPKVVANKLNSDKKLIKELCDKINQAMIDGGDPEAFKLETKEDYEGFVKSLTGLALEAGNHADIITRLESVK